MRIAALAIASLVSACAHGVGFAPRPLPELAVTGSPLAALEVKDFALEAGEAFAWNVQFQGLSIGRAELAVGDQEVRTKFDTNALASSFARAHYELVSVIDRNARRPIGAYEVIDAEGETTTTNASFDGKSYAIGDPPQSHSVPDGTVHSLHSALGIVRGWAEPQAKGGVLFVLVGGRVYKLVLSRPIPEDLHGAPALKLSGRIIPLEGSGPTVAIAMWLTANPAKAPLRIEVALGDKQVTAELIDG